MALNGKDGTVIWKTYTLHEIFAVNCEQDVNGDKIPDCLVAGRMAVMLESILFHLLSLTFIVFYLYLSFFSQRECMRSTGEQAL